MIYEFKFPDIGEGVAEGEITKWLVKQGEEIVEDQPIVELVTDKASVEITSPVSGQVKELLASEGDIIRVGTVIITFNTKSQQEVKKNEQMQTTKSIYESNEYTKTQILSDNVFRQDSIEPINGKNKLVLAVPTVRRLARELSVDLSAVKGTGKNGRVTDKDVRGFVEGKKIIVEDFSISTIERLSYDGIPTTNTSTSVESFGEAEKRIPLRGIRRTIAKSMQKSKTTAAHASILEEVDVTELVKLRKQLNDSLKKRGIHLTYLPFIIKSVVNSLKQYPNLNASIDDEKEEIVLKNYYNIGIATDAPSGLIVPVIKNADKKSIIELAVEISELADKARSQKIGREELRGGTFTLSNIGSTGVGTFATPVINLPEVAILGISRIQKKPVVKNDVDIVIRDMLGLSLTIDHRLIDGAMGSYFLKQIIQYLEQPNLLFMEMV